MDNQDVLKNAPEQSCKSIAANLSEWKCPHCYQDYNGLSIDSSIEMNVSIISCSECGLHFGDKCSEEELIKKFKKEYVMDKPMREMSLIELISSLPESHIARREYTEFLGRLSKEKNEGAQAHQEIEELKRERDVLLSRLCDTCNGVGMVGNIIESQNCPECSKKETINNLEQRAKGIDEAVDSLMFHEFNGIHFIQVEDLLEFNSKLKTQAKELV